MYRTYTAGVFVSLLLLLLLRLAVAAYSLLRQMTPFPTRPRQPLLWALILLLPS